MDLNTFFRDAMTTQITELELTLEQLDTDPEAEVRLRRLAHSLKGSGATYGYPRISITAAAAESADPGDLESSTRSLIESMRFVAEQTSVANVLVVDDDPLLRRLVEVRLANPDREIKSVGSLAEARATIADDRPDIVILDLFLPDGDGRSLLAELDDIPVIVLTGTPSPDHRAACMSLGAAAFVSKPFDVAALITAVNKIMPRPDKAEVTRLPLAEMYADLLSVGPVAVAAIVPELHGPGGMARRHDDEHIEALMKILDDALPPNLAIGRWSTVEIVAFGPGSPEAMRETLDKARLRLRNSLTLPDGSVASFSGGVTTGTEDFAGSFAHARDLAAGSEHAGGDRISYQEEDRQQRTVLVAEDDPLTAALVIHRLEREHYEVVHCPDGEAAVAMAGQRDFGLVILDIQMPLMDGFEVLQALRQRPAYAKTPILILTSVENERDVVRGFDLGCDDYVLKPFSPAELTARIRRFTRPVG